MCSPLDNPWSPRAAGPTHPKDLLQLLAHASRRPKRSYCQPSYISSSAPSATQLTIHAGRLSPAQAAILLTRLIMQARTQIAARAKCSVKPCHTATRGRCFHMLSNARALLSPTGRPVLQHAPRSKAFSKMIITLGYWRNALSCGRNFGAYNIEFTCAAASAHFLSLRTQFLESKRSLRRQVQRLVTHTPRTTQSLVTRFLLIPVRGPIPAAFHTLPDSAIRCLSSLII
jgi:hypothetical protein